MLTVVYLNGLVCWEEYEIKFYQRMSCPFTLIEENNAKDTYPFEMGLTTPRESLMSGYERKVSLENLRRIRQPFSKKVSIQTAYNHKNIDKHKIDTTKNSNNLNRFVNERFRRLLLNS